MVLNRFGHTLADVEREHILETLSACDGNRTRTARLLKISLRCLRMKLHRFGQSGPDMATAGTASPGRRGGCADVQQEA